MNNTLTTRQRLGRDPNGRRCVLIDVPALERWAVVRHAPAGNGPGDGRCHVFIGAGSPDVPAIRAALEAPDHNLPTDMYGEALAALAGELGAEVHALDVHYTYAVRHLADWRSPSIALKSSLRHAWRVLRGR